MVRRRMRASKVYKLYKFPFALFKHGRRITMWKFSYTFSLKVNVNVNCASGKNLDNTHANMHGLEPVSCCFSLPGLKSSVVVCVWYVFRLPRFYWNFSVSLIKMFNSYQNLLYIGKGWVNLFRWIDPANIFCIGTLCEYKCLILGKP